MTSLAEHIAAQLAEEDIEVSPEQIQSHIDSYEESAPKTKSKTVSAKGKPVPKGKVEAPAKGKKASSKASADEEKHTCERTINGKDGSRICGKGATNELNDMWFCGTEKSGCYKSALGKAASVPAPKAKAKAVPAKGSAKGKAAGVVQKVVKKERISLTEVPSGSGIWVDLNNFRTVYSQDPKEAYGILDEDDETILPLTEEAVAFAEAHGLPVRKKSAPKGKAVAKAAPKGKAVVAKPAPKAKAAPKVASKVAPKGKAVAKVAPKGKVVPKGKAAKGKPVQSDDELLDELQQEADDVEVEPDVEEEGEVPAEEEEEPEIDLGDGEDAGEGEAVEEDDEPDVEEVDEGEAADEDDVDEDEADGDDEE